MRTTIAAKRGTTAYDLDEDRDLVPNTLASSRTRRTQVTSVEPDWLSDVVSDWDAVFGETSTTATRAIDSGRLVRTCLYGDRPTAIAWVGRQSLILDDLSSTAMNWDVIVSRAVLGYVTTEPGVTAAPRAESPAESGSGSESTDVVTYGGTLAHSALALVDAPGKADVPSPEALAARSSESILDIVEAVQTVGSSLGVTERDVLAAAGIRERTYYYWKQHPGTAVRAGSQANLWGVVGSVAVIVAEYDRFAPRWLRADPLRFQLFLDGQHARLALLAAGATAKVRLPSDTLDAHNVAGALQLDDVEEQARVERLKRFRTRQPVWLTHDEDGSPLPRATGLSATFYADEPEDELILNDLDDDELDGDPDDGAADDRSTDDRAAGDGASGEGTDVE